MIRYDFNLGFVGKLYQFQQLCDLDMVAFVPTGFVLLIGPPVFTYLNRFLIDLWGNLKSNIVFSIDCRNVNSLDQSVVSMSSDILSGLG